MHPPCAKRMRRTLHAGILRNAFLYAAALSSPGASAALARSLSALASLLLREGRDGVRGGTVAASGRRQSEHAIFSRRVVPTLSEICSAGCGGAAARRGRRCGGIAAASIGRSLHRGEENGRAGVWASARHQSGGLGGIRNSAAGRAAALAARHRTPRRRNSSANMPAKRSVCRWRASAFNATLYQSAASPAHLQPRRSRRCAALKAPRALLARISCCASYSRYAGVSSICSTPVPSRMPRRSSGWRTLPCGIRFNGRGVDAAGGGRTAGANDGRWRAGSWCGMEDGAGRVGSCCCRRGMPARDDVAYGALLAYQPGRKSSKPWCGLADIDGGAGRTRRAGLLLAATGMAAV